MLIADRRLRVRDDGTGRARDEVAFIEEFGQSDAIVVLGDPGVGKSTLFRQYPDTYQTVRNFLIAPKEAPPQPLYLDAFDEYRAVAPGTDVIGTLSERLCTLGKPAFRLACRAADWFGSIDQQVLRVASNSGQVAVLELLPLSQEEIRSAISDLVPDADAFLAETQSIGVSELLSNPQSLELIALAWTHLWNLYKTKDNGDSCFWFTGGCGRPRKPGEGWPTDAGGKPQGSISDGKTSVGMDRTDDIKKSTFQVLKLGVEHRQVLETSDWKIGIGLLGNLPAARHYTDYLASYEEIVWAKSPPGSKPQTWSNLFDAVASFPSSQIRAEFLNGLLFF